MSVGPLPPGKGVAADGAAARGLTGCDDCVPAAVRNHLLAGRRLLCRWRDAAQFGKAFGNQHGPFVEGILGVRPGLERVQVAAGPGLRCADCASIDVGGVLAADLRIPCLLYTSRCV